MIYVGRPKGSNRAGQHIQSHTACLSFEKAPSPVSLDLDREQAQDRSELRVVQMTYKNLIFNNTNQFKNHQRHKNSFAGAYQEGGGGRGGGGQTKSHFISHFGITARKVTKMKLLR